MAKALELDLGVIRVDSYVHFWSYLDGFPHAVVTGEEDRSEVAEQLWAEHSGLTGRSR